MVSRRFIWPPATMRSGTPSPFQSATAGASRTSGDGLLPSGSSGSSGPPGGPPQPNPFFPYDDRGGPPIIPPGQINTGHCRARLIEVTPGAAGETVFELIVNDPAAADPLPLSSFRAEHFPDFGIEIG